ncbi:MAG: hypothetical protein ABUL49_01755, partial [bacterium]
LLEFVSKGGRLLVYGRIPSEDHSGRPATQLTQALGIKVFPVIQGSSDYFPSLQGVGFASGEPEVRVWQAQPFSAHKGQTFMAVVGSKQVAGSVIEHGQGKVVVLSAEPAAHPNLWQGIFDQVGATPRLTHNDATRGVVLNRLKGSRGLFISLVNLDQEDKTLRLSDGQSGIFLPGRTAKLLPRQVAFGTFTVVDSSTEIAAVEGNAVAFKRTAEPEIVSIDGNVKVADGIQKNGALGSVSSFTVLPGRGVAWFRGS